MDEGLVIEKSFHVTKLKLLEVFPLYPFLFGRQDLDVIEVGGNIGLWCEAFFDVFGHRTAVYRAYEPMPGNVALFRARIEREDLPVDLVESCVGDSDEDVTIHYDRDVTTLASVVVEDLQVGAVHVENKHELVVPQTTLDRVVAGRRVDVVKVDTEGYEWNVLEGGAESLKAGLIDNLYFEFGPHQEYLGQSFRQFFDLFTGYGYRIFQQRVGRNYFGLNEISHYHERFEDFSTMSMVLASRLGPSPAYRGPRVVGKIN